MTTLSWCKTQLRITMSILKDRPLNKTRSSSSLHRLCRATVRKRSWFMSNSRDTSLKVLKHRLSSSKPLKMVSLPMSRNGSVRDTQSCLDCPRAWYKYPSKITQRSTCAQGQKWSAISHAMGGQTLIWCQKLSRWKWNQAYSPFRIKSSWKDLGMRNQSSTAWLDRIITPRSLWPARDWKWKGRLRWYHLVWWALWSNNDVSLKASYSLCRRW